MILKYLIIKLLKISNLKKKIINIIGWGGGYIREIKDKNKKFVIKNNIKKFREEKKIKEKIKVINKYE